MPDLIHPHSQVHTRAHASRLPRPTGGPAGRSCRTWTLRREPRIYRLVSRGANPTPQLPSLSLAPWIPQTPLCPPRPSAPHSSAQLRWGFPWLARQSGRGWLLGRRPQPPSPPSLLVLCCAPCPRLPAGQLVWCRPLLPPLLPPKPCRARLHLGGLGRWGTRGGGEIRGTRYGGDEVGDICRGAVGS